MSFVFDSDPGRSAQRRRSVKTYLEQNLLTPTCTFICQSYQDCHRAHTRTHNFAPFIEGQMHILVGPHYDLCINGIPVRLVIVGKDYGGRIASRPGHPERSLMEVHYHDKFRSLRLRTWGPTQRGYGYVLRTLFGIPLGNDRASEYVPGLATRPVHMFWACSMTNLLLCTSLAQEGKQKSGAEGPVWKEMWGNCAQHFAKILEFLSPTIVVMLSSRMEDEVEHPPLRWNTDRLDRRWPCFRTDINGHSSLLAIFKHPSGANSWSWYTTPYFRDTVEPTLHLIQRTIGLS